MNSQKTFSAVWPWASSWQIWRFTASQRLEVALSLSFALAVASLFGSLNAPLWIDEFLHFGLAGQDWSQIFRTIFATSTEINHGQTWALQIASIASLKLFGASEFALRLPVIISTALGVFAGMRTLRIMGAAPTLQFGLISALMVIPEFAFQMGNARPYMPLVMATAFTAWALTSLWRTGKLGAQHRAIFAIGTITGALLHPYFPVVLIALLLCFSLVTKPVGVAYREVLFGQDRFIAIWSGASLFSSLIVGSATWMRGGPNFSSLDPFSTFPLGLEFEHFIAMSISFVSVVIGFLVFLSRRKSSEPFPAWIMPLVLCLVGLGLALLFSWVSFFRNYWIVPRQWLPGAYLFLVGATGLVSFCAKKCWNQAKRRVKFQASLLVFCVVAGLGLSAIVRETAEIRENHTFWVTLDDSLLPSIENRGEFFVIAANLNIKCGGKIWPELAHYYSYALDESFREFVRARYHDCML